MIFNSLLLLSLDNTLLDKAFVIMFHNNTSDAEQPCWRVQAYIHECPAVEYSTALRVAESLPTSSNIAEVPGHSLDPLAIRQLPTG